MPYTPNNLQMFTAAFAGALAGMGASDRVPTDTLQANYNGLASVAGAFAQSFDTEWGAVIETLLDIESAQELCEVAWQDRSPIAVTPFLTPGTYTGLSRALIAMIRAGSAYYTSQGIVPPQTPGGPSVLNAKDEARLATTANIVLSGLQVVDGIMTVANNRVLVKNQTNPIENGMLLASAGAWTRSSDVPVGSSAQGIYAFVAEGTINADLGFICSTNQPNDIVGTNPIAFTQFSAFALATVAPDNVTKSAAVVGLSTQSARADHKHDITTANVANIASANAEGVATSLARSDHAHNLPFTPVQIALAAANASLSINTQKITDVLPPTLGTDAANKNYVDASATPLSGVAPVNVTKSVAVVGISAQAARADHKHDITTHNVGNVASANAEGVAASLARSDHAHNLPFTPVQTALGIATGNVSVNSQKVTNVLAPTATTDAANKAYVDAARAWFKFSGRAELGLITWLADQGSNITELVEQAYPVPQDTLITSLKVRLVNAIVTAGATIRVELYRNSFATGWFVTFTGPTGAGAILSIPVSQAFGTGGETLSLRASNTGAIPATVGIHAALTI